MLFRSTADLLFPRDLVVDALDVEVHAKNLPVVEMVAALAFDGLAVLIHDRAFERKQFSIDDRGLGILGRGRSGK